HLVADRLQDRSMKRAARERKSPGLRDLARVLALTPARRTTRFGTAERLGWPRAITWKRGRMNGEALTEDILPKPTLKQEINRSLVRGSSWMVGMRLGIRGIGLISTMILARLLTPADFGIIAMAMLVIGFVEVFSETGQQAAIIRLACPERAHYDSAFTMAVMINGALTVVIFLIAPFAANYFHDALI